LSRIISDYSSRVEWVYPVIFHPAEGEKGVFVAKRHLSVEKRARQNVVRNRRNRVIKSAIRGALKKVEDNTDQAKTTAVTIEAQRVLDRAVTRNVVHKNKASRLKSRLMKKAGKAATTKTD